jgi:hypothetical protein
MDATGPDERLLGQTDQTEKETAEQRDNRQARTHESGGIEMSIVRWQLVVADLVKANTNCISITDAVFIPDFAIKLIDYCDKQIIDACSLRQLSAANALGKVTVECEL